MYTLRLLIPMLPDALNKTLRAGRWGNHAQNKKWDAYVASATYGQRPKNPLETASISLTRHSYRTLDYDGLVGSMKPVVDALVSAGILKDDSWKVLGAWNVTQTFRPKKDGVMLEIFVTEGLS